MSTTDTEELKIGAWLSDQLSSKRMSQAELARQLEARLGVPFDRSKVNKIGLSKRGVSFEEAQAIAAVLDTPLPNIFDPTNRRSGFSDTSSVGDFSSDGQVAADLGASSKAPQEDLGNDIQVRVVNGRLVINASVDHSGIAPLISMIQAWADQVD